MLKKNNAKFTIAFNPSIESHKKAIEILNKQGRKKADLIAIAIDIYLNRDKYVAPVEEVKEVSSEPIKEEVVAPAAEQVEVREISLKQDSKASDFSNEDISNVLGFMSDFESEE